MYPLLARFWAGVGAEAGTVGVVMTVVPQELGEIPGPHFCRGNGVDFHRRSVDPGGGPGNRRIANNLFFHTAPPSVPPNCACRNESGPFRTVVVGVAKPLRRNRKAGPWIWLLPDLLLVWMIAPPPRPILGRSHAGIHAKFLDCFGGRKENDRIYQSIVVVNTIQ